MTCWHWFEFVDSNAENAALVAAYAPAKPQDRCDSGGRMFCQRYALAAMSSVNRGILCGDEKVTRVTVVRGRNVCDLFLLQAI